MTLAMQVLQRLTAARAAEQGEARFVSGALLAGELAVTRSAVWKAIGTLRERGTEIEAITHRGYRLALPASPLTADGVANHLPPVLRDVLRHGECVGEIESTNSALLARGAPPPGRFDFLTAEYQLAGRGRLGRSWLAPPGGALCLSWSWCFEGVLERLGALSLATGVAVLRALRALGIEGVQLKWPNDLVSAEGKLGGILIELRSEVAGPLHVVVGLGLNLSLGASMREFIAAGGNRAADVASLTLHMPTRDRIVAAILEQNIALLQQYPRDGFASVITEYLQADALRDQAVQILAGGTRNSAGIARGVDAGGALLLERAGAIERIIAGEVSVRPEAQA